MTLFSVIILNSLVNTGLPIFISNGLDNLKNTPTASTLLILTAGIVVLGVLGWVFNAVRQWLSAAAIGNVTLQMREDAFDAVVKRRSLVL